MSKTTDEFIKRLENKIRQYRLEMLTDFYDTPQLLLGDGLRSFEILSMFIPTLTVGPRGYPVPGGAFSDEDNELKYPARSLEDRDILNSLPLRNTSKNESDAVGREVIPANDDERWHSACQQRSLVGGASAAANIVAGDAARYTEVIINWVNVQPVDAQVPVTVVLNFVATGGFYGGGHSIALTYLFDFSVASVCHGNTHIAFPQGYKFRTLDISRGITLAVSGGLDTEKVTIGYDYRWVA